MASLEETLNSKEFKFKQLEMRVGQIEANIRGINAFNMGFQRQLETLRSEFEVLKKIALGTKRCPKCQEFKK